ELAPRIKALFAKKEELQQVKAEAEEALRYRTIELADPRIVREYVQDLKALLEESSIIEQKAFLRGEDRGRRLTGKGYLYYLYRMAHHSSLALDFRNSSD
ncbi:hypothetical protein M1N47_04100, partial [Dehalococcoidia bacterium]|nr:hypothetical protein [Dehalococcoidia bacterium]